MVIKRFVHLSPSSIRSFDRRQLSTAGSSWHGFRMLKHRARQSEPRVRAVACSLAAQNHER